MEMALIFLKKERFNVMFYLSFLIICNAVMSFYFNFALNQSLVLNDQGSSLLLSTLSLGIIMFVVLLGFYAGNSFIRIQTQLVGLFRLTGASLNAILSFLMIQYALLLGISLPIGAILGHVALFVFTQVVLNGIGFGFSMSVLFAQLFANFMEIFFLLLVSYGFVYRNDVIDLIQYHQTIDMEAKKPRILGFSFPIITSILCLFLVIVLIFTSDATPYIYFMVGLMGIAFIPKSIKTSLYQYLKRARKQLLIKKSNWMVAFAHSYILLKDSIQFIQIISVLLLGVICFHSIFIQQELMLKLGASMFTVAIFSLFYALYFQLNIAIQQNIEELLQLKLLGYSIKDVQAILTKEISLAMLLLTSFILILPISVGLKLSFTHQINLIYFISTIIIALVCVVSCMIMMHIHARQLFNKKLEK